MAAIGSTSILGELQALLFLNGAVLLALAGGMLPPLWVDLAVGNPDWQAFLAACAATAVAGGTLVVGFRRPGMPVLRLREAFLLTTSVWVVAAGFGALPFAFAEPALSVTDAFFEAMSGLTTTGSTVMTGLDHAPPGLLLWRAILQWVGGAGIIVAGIAVLPILSVGGMQLFRTESSDRSDKVLPRAADIAGAVLVVYLLLSLACLASYRLLGMPLLDAVAHAMTTIATGGYSTSDSSVGVFRSPAIEWAATFFMLSGAVPFVMYIRLLRGQRAGVDRDPQVLALVLTIAAATAALALWLVLRHGVAPIEALRLAAFNVTSIVTTTGYASADYGQWGLFPVAVMHFLTCVGGCTGSTSGGIKMFRLVVLWGAVRAQLRRLLQAHGISTLTYGGRPVSDEISGAVMGFLTVFVLCVSGIALGLSALGLDFVTALSGAVTALANVGPGLGEIIGPAGNFQPLPDAAKWLLCFAMLLGRLELFTVLVVLSPTFWRD